MFNIDGSKLEGRMQSKIRCRFVNKLKITEEEADEANYFLDVIASVDNGDLEKC
jgi:hypothetical protein